MKGKEIKKGEGGRPTFTQRENQTCRERNIERKRDKETKSTSEIENMRVTNPQNAAIEVLPT